MNVILIVSLYLAAVNIIGFATMGIDKHKARKQTFRIPEAALFTVAFIGGSLGTTLGMFIFHHKTRHWYFLYGMPVILFLQILFIFSLNYFPVTFEFM